jgi:hypothetical protein
MAVAQGPISASSIMSDSVLHGKLAQPGLTANSNFNGGYLMIDCLSEFQPRRFNALQSIEVVDQRMRAAGRLEQAREILGPVFIRHGVQDVWGIGLLHRHWSLADHEISLERCHDDEYVSAPDGLVRNVYPRTLGVSKAGLFEPIEYSSEKNIRDACGLLSSGSRFSKEFRKKFVEFGFEDMFALVALKNAKRSGHGFLEHNDESRRSIVREVPVNSLDKSGQLQTAWYFSGEANVSCAMTCGGYCQEFDNHHKVVHDPVHEGPDPGEG